MTSYFSLLPPDLLDYVKKSVQQCVYKMRDISLQKSSCSAPLRASPLDPYDYDYATRTVDDTFLRRRAQFELDSWSHLCAVMGADVRAYPDCLNKGFWAFVEQKPVDVAVAVRLFFPPATLPTDVYYDRTLLFEGALATSPEPAYTELLAQHYASLGTTVRPPTQLTQLNRQLKRLNGQ